MNEQKIKQDIIYLARNNSQLALERANKLVKEWPDKVWVWWLRSDVYEIIGDFKNAMSDVDYAINKWPDEIGGHFKKAGYLVKISDYEGAVYYFSNAIEIGSKLEWYYYDSASRFKRAFCYCKIGQFEAAELDLEKVDDDTMAWIDCLRTKAELLEACRNRTMD